MRRLIYLYALTIGGSLAGLSHAQGLSGLYFGGSFGRAENTYDTAFVDGQYQGAVASLGDTLKYKASSVNRWDYAWWADAGYMPLTYLGIEAMFIHAGELTHRGAGSIKTSTGTESFADTTTIRSHGPALSVVIRLPLADSFAADVRLGDFYGKTILTAGSVFNSRYSAVQETHTGSSLLAGVGAAYSFAEHWSIRLDYLRIEHAGDNKDVGPYSVNLGAVGATFTF